MNIHRFIFPRGMVALLTCLTLALPSCKEEVPVQPSAPVKPGAVLIINEGNFQWGNGSLCVYDPTENKTEHEVYKRANGKPLGDVFQSVSKWNGRLYLVVNNSQKIEVIHPETLKSEQEITGLTSPRYLVFAGGKAYVSDLYANGVNVLDPVNGKVTGKISCKGWTEQMLLHGRYLYISNLHSKSLYRLDTATEIISDSIQIGFGSGSLALDRNNKIWLACKGNASLGISPSITVVDPVTFSVVKNITLPYEPTNICMNNGRDKVYYIHGQNVVRMAIADSLYTQDHVLIPGGGRNFYGLGIDPVNGDIYVSDAKDFSQKGDVLRYSEQGNLITVFAAGIIPRGFHFEP